MNTLLYFSLKDPCPRWLVEVGDLEDMCCIDPIIRTTTHYMISFNIEFKDGYLDNRQLEFPPGRHCSMCWDEDY